DRRDREAQGGRREPRRPRGGARQPERRGEGGRLGRRRAALALRSARKGNPFGRSLRPTGGARSGDAQQAMGGRVAGRRSEPGGVQRWWQEGNGRQPRRHRRQWGDVQRQQRQQQQRQQQQRYALEQGSELLPLRQPRG